ncbi:Zn-ribbon domain-containing OB-fold protein [Halorientalis brevis]|uniref:Zn-ribbon domain-containing OB-fold protein n=1 Tax=Halorientalis brevis TaxID=1126241 RepID=A0ABD6CBB0_9EURY|nr:OB-fold domain-containing protein [Halorientalis brevis]
MTDARDGEYDDLLDAIEDGEGYYLECENGHGSLPPRLACPQCGSQELSEEPLPESGEISTYTVVTVPTPQFEDDAPYVTAIADFGPVSITGQITDVDPEDVETGDVVGIGVSETVTNEERLIAFEPR